MWCLIRFFCIKSIFWVSFLKTIKIVFLMLFFAGWLDDILGDDEPSCLWPPLKFTPQEILHPKPKEDLQNPRARGDKKTTSPKTSLSSLHTHQGYANILWKHHKQQFRFQWVKWSKEKFSSQINTMEETFQSHLIDTSIFQTKSFDVLSEFALLVSCATCSAYSAVLLRESE